MEFILALMTRKVAGVGVWEKKYIKQVCIPLNVKLLNGIMMKGFVIPMFSIDCIINGMHELRSISLSGRLGGIHHCMNNFC